MKEWLTTLFTNIFSINQLLNMRQKLFIAFSAFALASGVLGAFSYYNLVRVEDKFFIVETADDISKVILEIQHYEKNFYLYSREGDAIETFRLIDNALQLAELFEQFFVQNTVFCGDGFVTPGRVANITFCCAAQ